MQECIYVPAGHESILRRNSDNPWHLVAILAVCDKPGDWFRMISSYVFDGHCVFRV